MTQQFKFGDIVRDIDGKEFVYIRATATGCLVASQLGNIHHLLGEFFTPIPHPDTARLDWLAKNDCALTERLIDEDGDRHDTPFAVIQKQEEHFKVLAAANNIRQAIDAAMHTEEQS